MNNIQYTNTAPSTSQMNTACTAETMQAKHQPHGSIGGGMARNVVAEARMRVDVIVDEGAGIPGLDGLTVGFEKQKYAQGFLQTRSAANVV